MNDPIFANISRIIEADNKSTTYKFALLRGVVVRVNPWIQNVTNQ